MTEEPPPRLAWPAAALTIVVASLLLWGVVGAAWFGLRALLGDGTQVGRLQPCPAAPTLACKPPERPAGHQPG